LTNNRTILFYTVFFCVLKINSIKLIHSSIASMNNQEKERKIALLVTSNDS